MVFCIGVTDDSPSGFSKFLTNYRSSFQNSNIKILDIKIPDFGREKKEVRELPKEAKKPYVNIEVYLSATNQHWPERLEATKLLIKVLSSRNEIYISRVDSIAHNPNGDAEFYIRVFSNNKELLGEICGALTSLKCNIEFVELIALSRTM